MIKEIKYGGFSASPSDYESPDGELAALIGLVPDEGNLTPIMPPKALFELEGGRVIRFVHETSAFRHYIILDPATNIVSWTEDGKASTQLYNFTKSRTIHNINAIGNTIVILADNGMHYLLWKGDTDGYLYLGTHLPELPISFGLQATMKKVDDFTIDYDGIAQSDWGNVDFTDNNKNRVTEQVMAKVNKFINEESVNKGKFIFPFFIRYAFRLYDGSLTMHSAPVLMNCADALTPDCKVSPVTKTGKWEQAVIRIYAAIHDIDMAVLEQSYIDEVKKWSDIITSVDIFISSPIYMLDQSGKCTRFYKPTSGDTYSSEYCGSVCKHVNPDAGVASKRLNEGYAYRTYSSMFNDTYPLEWNADRKFDYTVDLPHFTAEEFNEKIKSVSNFYLLKSIKPGSLSTNRSKIEISEDYLQSLVSRERMTDDYYSHDLLIPKGSFVYNSRLNLVNIQKRMFDGFKPLSLFTYKEGKTSNAPFIWSSVDSAKQYFTNTLKKTDIYIHIKTEQGESIVHNSGLNSINTTFNIETLDFDGGFAWFFYPNSKAVSVDIVSDGKKHTFPLVNSNVLNGAVYFNNLHYFGIESLTPCPTTKNETYNILNKIYNSEVNNPFHFPVLGINTVGTGTILGISTAAKALSQGQFGQFPLYAFTTEGVWALEVSNTGGYSAKQPITRDVCINADSITQLDSAVLFATDRGIMLISGSNSQCISDTLDYSQVFSIDSLPEADKLVTMAGFKAEDFAYVPFRDYLLGCRMIYAYTQQRVIVYNPAHSYAYVYSLKTKTWGMMQSTVADNVPSYPEALAMLKDGTLVDFCTDAAQQQDEDGHLQGIKGLLITRPLKLDAPDLLKTIDTAIQRGNFRKGSIKSALYGSRDLQNWSLIWTSQDHYLRGFRGTPYKYFRFAILCDMQPDESLFGATIQYTPRLLNQPR